MAKGKIINSKVFKINIWNFCQNILQKWEGKTLSKWFLIFKQLEKCQIRYYPDKLYFISFSRRISLRVLIFSISVLKSNLWSDWKGQTFE